MNLAPDSKAHWQLSMRVLHRLVDKYQTSGHPICPECGIPVDDYPLTPHEDGCAFAEWMRKYGRKE